MESKAKKIRSLFITFFKIGAFTFGGGYAMIPLIQKEIAENKKWITDKEILDVIAIAESTPGPIGVNMATYAGYNAGFAEMGTLGGVLGGIIATLGLVTPSVIVIVIIAGFLKAFKENKYVKSVFSGIRPVVTALVLFAVFGIIKPIFYVNGEFALPVIAISVVVFGLMFIKKLKKLHPAFWLALGAVAGILLKL